MLRFFRPISSWFLLTSGWIEPLLVGGYAPFSPVVEYRSVRFGISYYTIWDIVLYDLKYRTIRFGISYYTIWDIVLYDLGYRSVRFRETLSGVAKTRVMGWGEASCNLQPTPHVALGHADGCLWRQQVSHLPMGLQIGRDVAFDCL